MQKICKTTSVVLSNFIVIFKNRPELKPIEKEVEVKLKFPEVEPLNPPVIAMNEVGFAYDSDQMIFNNVNLSGTSDSRICIVSVIN